jgi:hypothetical protein
MRVDISCFKDSGRDFGLHVEAVDVFGEEKSAISQRPVHVHLDLKKNIGCHQLFVVLKTSFS